MKWKWEARKKHREDWLAIVQSRGWMDGQGRLRKFSGLEFWPEFNRRGHTSADFETCECGWGLPEQDVV